MISRPSPAYLLLFILAFFLLTGCQSNAGQPTITVLAPTAVKTVQNTAAPTLTPSPVPSPTLPAHLLVSAEDLQGTIIQFWHPWQGEMETLADAMVADFNRSNQWGITVRAEAYYNSSSLQEAVNQSMADIDADLPQVVAASADQLAAWSEAGDAVVDLNEYVRHPAYGFTQKEIGSFVPAFWNQDQVGERQLGIPALRSAQVLFYNQTWAKELGFLVPPVNTAEFKKQACAAAVENNASRNRAMNGTGGWLVNTDALTTISWMHAFGAEFLPTGEGESFTFESEQAEESLKFLRGMMDEGCAWVSREKATPEYFSNRMALLYSGTLSDLYVQKRHNTIINNTDDWIILPFPGKNGQTIVYASGPSYGILRAAPEAQMAAWLFTRWMAQPSNLARLAELLPSIPVSSAVEAQVADYRMNFPWNAILPLRKKSCPLPVTHPGESSAVCWKTLPGRFTFCLLIRSCTFCPS
jgi:multiple sugar transport system substrate-binding protein